MNTFKVPDVLIEFNFLIFTNVFLSPITTKPKAKQDNPNE